VPLRVDQRRIGQKPRLADFARPPTFGLGGRGWFRRWLGRSGDRPARGRGLARPGRVSGCSRALAARGRSGQNLKVDDVGVRRQGPTQPTAELRGGLAQAALRRPRREVAEIHSGRIARLKGSYSFNIFRKVHLAAARKCPDGLVLAKFTDLKWHVCNRTRAAALNDCVVKKGTL